MKVIRALLIIGLAPTALMFGVAGCAAIVGQGLRAPFKLALCPARVAASWQQRGNLNDMSSLPIRPCIMRTPTGGFKCSRSTGCNADFDPADYEGLPK